MFFGRIARTTNNRRTGQAISERRVAKGVVIVVGIQVLFAMAAHQPARK